MSKRKTTNLKSGQRAPVSGQYEERGPRGGHGKEVTVKKGNRLPPVDKSGTTFDLVDPTKNKSGRP